MTTVSALLTAAVLVPATAATAAALPPEGAAIERITASGTGCTPDSFTSEWDDATEFRVRYGSFSARAGGAATPPDTRRACVVSVQLAIPEGYTVALNAMTAHRYVNLADGARVMGGTKAYWQGSRDEIKWSDSKRGPADGAQPEATRSISHREPNGLHALSSPPGCGSCRPVLGATA